MHLEDVLGSIGLIETFVDGLDSDSYRDDLKTKSAVERQLQILTEAAYRLGDDAEQICPGPDWKGYMGMGNLLRHSYHRIDDQIVWDTVKMELPALKEAVLRALVSGPPLLRD